MLILPSPTLIWGNLGRRLKFIFFFVPPQTLFLVITMLYKILHNDSFVVIVGFTNCSLVCVLSLHAANQSKSCFGDSHILTANVAVEKSNICYISLERIASAYALNRDVSIFGGKNCKFCGHVIHKSKGFKIVFP